MKDFYYGLCSVKFLKTSLVYILLSLLALQSHAQDTRRGEWISCFEASVPSNLRRSEITTDLTTSVGAFQIWGTDIPELALPAIESALGLWSSKINSSIPIKVQLNWVPVDGNFLAQTRPVKYLKNFSPSAPPNIWYPITLAEKIADKELNESMDFEIEISVNAAINWYYGTDGQVGAEEFDFMTIILHELAHGLGFVSSANLSPIGLSLSSDGYFDIYDQQLVSADYSRLSAFNDDPSLLDEMVSSDEVFFLGENNQLIPCYAHGLFLPSVSLSHLDEDPEQKKLMTPFFGSGDAFHVIDSYSLAVLRSLGWSQKSPIQLTNYPNPTAERINFRLPVYLDKLSISAYNTHGQKIMDFQSQTTSNTLISLDVGTLDPGLYFFTLANTKYRFHQTVKVVVNR